MAVPSRPQHLAKPNPRRSDTGKKNQSARIRKIWG